MDGGGSSSSGAAPSAHRRAERRERRERERRRKGAEKSDEAFGGDDVAVSGAFLSGARGVTSKGGTRTQPLSNVCVRKANNIFVIFFCKPVVVVEYRVVLTLLIPRRLPRLSPPRGKMTSPSW